MDVSIIIINFNSSDFTIDCINSIYKYTQDITFEIIIIDNASQKADLHTLKTALSQTNVTLIESKKNLGFGGGNDLGYQFAKGAYLAFINNDVLLNENSLLKLKNHIETDTSIGVLGCHQVDEKGNFFKYSYRQFIDLNYHLFGQKKPHKYYSKKHGEEGMKKPFTVDQVSGALMFFNTEKYAEIGGFDTNIFLFYEEMDICKRLKSKGYKTVFFPNTTFTHFMGKSSTNTKIKREYTVSYLYIIQKNYSYLYFSLLRFILLFKYGIKSIFKPKRYLTPFITVLKGGNSLVYSLKP